MSNMGYCRFRNTLLDLQDCYESMQDDLESTEEHQARKDLVTLCKDIVNEIGHLDEEDDEFEDEDE